jgi:hypothetical protein
LKMAIVHILQLIIIIMSNEAMVLSFMESDHRNFSKYSIPFNLPHFNYSCPHSECSMIPYKSYEILAHSVFHSIIGNRSYEIHVDWRLHKTYHILF